jgi:hypothetical protein
VLLGTPLHASRTFTPFAECICTTCKQKGIQTKKKILEFAFVNNSLHQEPGSFYKFIVNVFPLSIGRSCGLLYLLSSHEKTHISLFTLLRRPYHSAGFSSSIFVAVLSSVRSSLCNFIPSPATFSLRWKYSSVLCGYLKLFYYFPRSEAIYPSKSQRRMHKQKVFQKHWHQPTNLHDVTS